MARGHFGPEGFADKYGNIAQLVGLDLTICQRGTTTPISDDVYDAFTSGNNLGQTVTIDTEGEVEFYYDAGGTHLPGIVTLYRAADSTFNTTISKTVNCFGNPGDTTPAGGIPAATVTAKGDLIVGTANATIDNLPYSASNYDMLAVATGQTMGLAYLPIARQGADFVVYWDASNSLYTAAGPGQTTVTSATDCASVINSAITALGGAGTILVIPVPTKRVYSCLTTIAINQNGITLRGAGGHHRATVPLGPVVLKMAAAQTNLINVTSFYAHIDNIALDGNGLATNVVAAAQQSGKITNCSINNGTSYTVLGSALGWTIQNCNLQQTDPDLAATPAGNLRVSSTDWIIVGNRINRGGSTAGVGLVYLEGAANQFTNNHVTGVVSGAAVGAASASLLYTGAARNRIADNFFDSCDGTAMITLANADTQFTGNLLYQSGGVAADNTVPAIDCTSATSTTVLIDGNHFVAGVARRWTYAVSCTGGGFATSGMFNNNMVSNCVALYDTKPGSLGLNMVAGKPTQAVGTATFAAATTKVVNHGLFTTPTYVNVVPAGGALNSDQLAVGTFTSTQFTVTAETSNSDSFYWEAKVI